MERVVEEGGGGGIWKNSEIRNVYYVNYDV